VVTGSFSLVEAIPKFVATGVGGVAIGLVAGRIIREIRSRIDDPPTEITISILSGYAAYLPAEELGASGVIAAVTVGLYMGWHTPQLTTPLMRLQGVAIWEILTFLLNATLFLLVGLQLPGVIDRLSGHSAGELAAWALLVSAVVIAVRLVWMLVIRYAVTMDGADGPRRAPPAEHLVVGWAGMRGSVSLAAALAIPLSIDAGGPFPDRGLIVFLTFAVILATLIGQGLTLGPLITSLGLHDEGLEEHEERIARQRVAEAGLERLDRLGEPDWIAGDSIERARNLLDYRRRRFTALVDGDGDGFEERAGAWRRLMYDVYDAQREQLVDLRNRGEISDEVRRKIERDLDLEESRLEN
jgi:CPA1 family monovalent cation:H+ antiporter